jgi:hypothetical protein
MAFSQSFAGSLTARLWSNPVVGTAATFGVGAGLYAGTSDFITTDGTVGKKADAGATSARKYALRGAAAVGGLGVAAAMSAKLDGYGGNFTESVGYGAAKFGRRGARSAGSYTRTIMSELKTPGGWKSTLMRPTVSGGIGAVVGGIIGSQISDDPDKGAVLGTVAGAAAGVAINRGVKASKIWSKLGATSRVGLILSASALLGGALKVVNGSQPDVVDRPQPEDNGYRGSGIQGRMDRMGASGDLVFGLHRTR